MLSCPNGACDWAIPKVRIAAHECYMCGTDLASELDPQMYAKFVAARAACTTATSAASPTPLGNAASTAAAPVAQAQATDTYGSSDDVPFGTVVCALLMVLLVMVAAKTLARGWVCARSCSRP